MDQNIELLEYIYQDSNMGVKSLTNLINTINNKDNKIKKVVEEQLKGYEKFLKISKKLLEKNGAAPKNTSSLAEVGAWMGIKVEMMKDNSDSRVANMVIKGLNIGAINMEKKISDYKKYVSEEILKIAKEFLNFQNSNMESLKKYL